MEEEGPEDATEEDTDARAEIPAAIQAVQTHVDMGVRRGRHCDGRATPARTNVTYCRSRLARFVSPR